MQPCLYQLFSRRAVDHGGLHAVHLNWSLAMMQSVLAVVQVAGKHMTSSDPS